MRIRSLLLPSSGLVTHGSQGYTSATARLIEQFARSARRKRLALLA
jgi:hypothetical protein